MSRSVGSVPVVQVDATAQYSSHVVNLVVPGFANTPGPADAFDEVAAAQYFYQYLGDDYDFLTFVFAERPFRGAVAGYHRVVQNQIQGIGMATSNSSATYGTADDCSAPRCTWSS
jgi:hypothetical protein